MGDPPPQTTNMAVTKSGRFPLQRTAAFFLCVAALTRQFRAVSPVPLARTSDISLYSSKRVPISNSEEKWELEEPSAAGGNVVMESAANVDTAVGGTHPNGHRVDFVPDEYKFVVTLGIPSGTLNSTLVTLVRRTVAVRLGLQEENVRISHIGTRNSSVEMYVVYTALDSLQRLRGVQVLIPASQVLRQLTPAELRRLSPSLPIVAVVEKKETKEDAARHALADAQMWSVLQKQMWETWQLPFLIASTLLFILVLVVVFLFLCFRQQIVKKVTDEEQAKHMCVFPVVKPCIRDTDPVQPEGGVTAYLSEDELKILKTEPMRIRAKGLLERRGSNTSLTIDLNPSPESSVTYSSPSRESNNEEFLTSAGNRMTRKQLRACLKDIKALHSEFWDIPMNYPEKVEIAGSGTKNRYKTIIPNEHTRVKLIEVNHDALSTYINANFVRGYDGEEAAYIAAQGPMVHTIDDFWQLVWQEKVPIIVMITKLKEKNKVKCEPYIPTARGMYGNVEVTTTKVTPREGYTIRELFLRNGNLCHQVQHFWFTAWPDHKTPATPKQLIAMAVEVESHRCDNNGRSRGPVVVHCSAGIGRTGCFIGISIGMQQLLEENMVDVLGIICAMRIDRGGMIQTAEQYEFVHRCLAAFERSLPDVAGE